MWKRKHEIKGAKKYYGDVAARLLDYGITGRGVVDHETNNIE